MHYKLCFTLFSWIVGTQYCERRENCDYIFRLNVNSFSLTIRVAVNTSLFFNAQKNSYPMVGQWIDLPVWEGSSILTAARLGSRPGICPAKKTQQLKRWFEALCTINDCGECLSLKKIEPLHIKKKKLQRANMFN